MAETPQEWLVDWFRSRAPEVALGPEDNYFVKGVVDSFDVIVLIEEVEQHWGIRFAEADFQDRRFATLGGLAALIGEKRPGRDG